MDILWSQDPKKGRVIARARQADGPWVKFVRNDNLDSLKEQFRYPTLTEPARQYFKLGLYWPPCFQQQISLECYRIIASKTESGLMLGTGKK
jgi:hypothetical protein